MPPLLLGADHLGDAPTPECSGSSARPLGGGPVLAGRQRRPLGGGAGPGGTGCGDLLQFCHLRWLTLEEAKTYVDWLHARREWEESVGRGLSGVLDVAAWDRVPFLIPVSAVFPALNFKFAKTRLA